jgi:hypothetical protein
MDVAARRQAAEALRHAVHQFAARQAGQAGQQAVEAEIGAVLADEVQHQAALLAWRQAQPAADLLLEQHRALRGPQQQQRVDHRQVDALVVEVDSHQRAQFAALRAAAARGGVRRHRCCPPRRRPARPARLSQSVMNCACATDTQNTRPGCVPDPPPGAAIR